MAELAKVPGLRWRLYYDDGSTFSNLDGEPWESPLDGCVGFIQTSTMWNADRGNEDGDIYIWREDKQKWFACNRWGYHNQQRRFARFITCVRYGEHVTDDEWNALKSRRDNDPDFFAPAQKQRRVNVPESD